MIPFTPPAATIYLPSRVQQAECGLNDAERSYRVPPRQQLSLGCERPGVRLEVIRREAPDPADGRWLELRCQHGSSAFRLVALQQLHGLIHIDDPTAALRFVRLRTSPALCLYWGLPYEVEVVTSDQARVLPAYGQPRALAHDVSFFRGTVIGGLPSGASRAGAFSPATAVRTPGGFRLVRYLYQQPSRVRPGRIIKVRELVGADGRYLRQVLRSFAPPRLPSFDWFINTLGG